MKTGWKEAIKFGPFEQGDLQNCTDIDRVFRKYRTIAIMYFAEFSQVNESMQKPELYWKNNVIGSVNLIQLALNHGCQNFIFSSTCATYGPQDNVFLDQACAQYPINDYGAFKLAVENILSNFETAYGLKHVIFRYFNAGDADPDAEAGEFHQPETKLIPLVLDVINGQREALTIFGTDYDTPDGTCIRDYVHLCDLIDAHLLGLKWLQDGKDSRVFNLSTDTGFSVREVIGQTIQISNRQVPVKEVT